MCVGFGQQVLIPPTERARLMADYLRGCFALLLLFALCEFLGTKFFSGIFDILALGLGYLAIRSTEGFNYQQVLCFLMLQAVFGVMSLVYLIFLFAGVNMTADKVPTVQWMFDFFVAAHFAGPLVYSLTVYFSYSIYREMKAVVDEMVSGMQQQGGAPGPNGPLMGNGYDVQAPASQREERQQQQPLWRHAESHPAPPPSAPTAAAGGGGGGGGSFQAFSGTGRKLGE